MPTSTPREMMFKVVLIGDGAVGKTSIRKRYLGEGFKKSHLPTIGVDFAQKYVFHKGGSVRLVIWDLAGQPSFKSVRSHYYKGSSGIIFVYSVIDKDSFDNASKWLVEAYKHMGPLPPTAIIGNKVDLRIGNPGRNAITTAEGGRFAQIFNERLNIPATFWETSAVTGENIDNMFANMIEMMKKYRMVKKED
jgi:small GTP-binding protein